MMEHLYDTHFHLDLQKDRSAAIREIEDNQIYTIAVTNLPDLYKKEVSAINSKYIRIALGFHPELVYEYKKQIPLMWELLPEARFVGEVGLDLVDKSHRKEQMGFFGDLVERCKYDNNKIISIHSRGAVSDVLDIIGNGFHFKPILHWFTGTKEQLNRAVDAGFWFSVNSAMLRTKRFVDFLSIVPASRILLETDSPFVKTRYGYSQEVYYLNSELHGIDCWANFKALLSV